MNANDDISSTDGAPTAEGADPTGSIGAPAASFPISPPPPPGADPSTVPAYGGVGTPPYGYGVAGPSWYGGAGTPWYGGAGAPPYGSGGAPVAGPGGEPWAAPPLNRATRRHRARTALAAGATATVLGAAAAGVLIGHIAWSKGSSSSSAAASVPAGAGGTGSGTSGAGSSGSGISGSGTSGSGTSGSGTSGSASAGSGGSGSSGSGSSGSGGSPFGSFGSSASGQSSTASGAPSNAAAIAKKVDAGLVDIDTTLGYAGEEAAGTGMVLTSDGEILTNNHVIDGATTIKVTDIGNGKTYSATVVGYDRTQDVAVLQLVKASGLTTVTLGDSSKVTVGQAVVGIGNAGGTGGTPSYAGGSATALNQSITASDEGGGNSEKLVDLIETNADIQAGDSGGSLVDTSGHVIGMDTAASSATQFQAATTAKSYAIPINEAAGLAKAIVAGKGSSVIHIGTTAMLGVEINPDATSVYGGTVAGASVSGVVSGTPAAGAGLVAGDTITAVDGKTVAAAAALTTDLGRDKPGDAVQITYVDSSGQSHTVTVQLASGPPQ
jgi:S1-C subfamily serine protease